MSFAQAHCSDKVGILACNSQHLGTTSFVATYALDFVLIEVWNEAHYEPW
jgi:hypothetical protein